VAKSTSGKWVSRVGSAGGGKTYSKTRPSSFYAVVVLIVVLGLALVVFSRYEYQHPVKKVVVEPAIGTTEFAGLSIQDCGTTLPYLKSDSTDKGGFIVGSDNVIRVSPVSASDAGNNATVATFALEYPGLVATSKELAVPTAAGGTPTAADTFKNGDVCGPTTKYSGKTGKVVYAYWTTLAQKTPTLTTNPAKIKFVKNLRLTMAFEPTGVTPTAPSQATENEMVLQSTTSATTTTTLPVTTTTVGPATTTTTTSGTTTTTKG
jgi:hypothetical protein